MRVCVCVWGELKTAVHPSNNSPGNKRAYAAICLRCRAATSCTMVPPLLVVVHVLGAASNSGPSM